VSLSLGYDKIDSTVFTAGGPISWCFDLRAYKTC
jgi:hypothetical protein